MTTPKLHALALTVLLGLGLVPVALAAPDAATAQAQAVASEGLQFPLADGTLTLQMPAPGVLHVHYLPKSGATPASLVMAPPVAGATPFRQGFAASTGLVS